MSDLKQFNQMIVKPNTQEYLLSVLNTKKDQFVNDLTALVANDANLQACEPVTIMYAAIKATALSLPLDKNLGFAYVIPYHNSKTKKTEAQFQIGYKGLKQLAIRSGQYKVINVTDVREGELKQRDRRTGHVTVEWIEDNEERNNRKIIGYLGYFALLNGYEKESYWSVKELEEHGLRYSQSYKKGYGLWKDDFRAMAEKTVLKLMLNKGDAPLSVEMQQAVTFDQAVMYDPNTPEYRDNEPKSAQDAADELMAEDVEYEGQPVGNDGTIPYDVKEEV